MAVADLVHLDSYRLIGGAVVDLQQLDDRARAFVSDLALRLSQGQGYQELVGRVMHPSAPIYADESPLAPDALDLPAVRVARDLVYRAGVAEGIIRPRGAEGSVEPLPRGVRVVRDAAGVPQAVPASGQALTTEEIVTVGEAMAMLGITRQAVINAVRNARIRGEQHGSIWILSREDVLRYRAARSARSGDAT